jgi:IS30 family transposase
MPRKRDLELERLIFQLQARGLGVRAISRELNISTSTVSRVLQREPTQELVNEFIRRVESLEEQMKLTKECIAILSQVTVQFGRHYRQKILELLMKWPGGDFRERYDRNQI